MPQTRHPASWTILFAGLMLLAGGLAAGGGTPSQEYHGTIYYAEHDGIWKVQLPGLEKTRLVSQELVDPIHMELSPDQEWLAYIDTRDEFHTMEPTVLWVLNTQGGTPVKVTEKVRRGTSWLATNQLLYQDMAEQGPFLFDPPTGTRQLAGRWRPAFGHCWMWVIPSGVEEVLQSCAPDDPFRGYLRIADLAGSHPITITEPYGGYDDVKWSHDGERVLFRERSGDSEKLYVWSRREGSQRQVIGEVSHRVYEFRSLTWSPDGQWATFVSHDDWYAVEIATGRVVPFGPIVPVLQAYPQVWSPDSRAILVPLTPPGQSDALLTFKPITLEFRLSIVGIPAGDILTLTSGDDFPGAFTWGSK